MVAEFVRFYGYTAQEALDEFAIRFFSLCNTMVRLQAQESMTDIVNTAAALSGGEEVMNQYKKQARGLPGVLDEVRTVRP